MINLNQETPRTQRFIFAWLNDGLCFRFKRDCMDHKQWLQQDFNISDTEFEEVVVGCILPGQIQVYKGNTLSKVNMAKLDMDDIKLLAVFCYLAFGTENNVLCNGGDCPLAKQQPIAIPDMDSEEWDPIDKRLGELFPDKEV